MDRIRKEYDINESEAIVINGLEVNALTGLYLSHTFFGSDEIFNSSTLSFLEEVLNSLMLYFHANHP